MPAPRQHTARLIWRNRRARARAGGAFALLACVAAGVLFCAERTAVAPVLQALRRHGYLCFGLAAVLSATLISRRRVLERARYMRSWLAAVPVKRSTARWEALLIDTLPASTALAVCAILALFAALIFAQRADVVAVWAAVSGGVVVGVIIGHLIPPPKPVDLPPGSRYVPQRAVARAAPLRPSFAALGQWPIRQMFAWAQPKAVARATLPILVMMPLGTTADTAMVAIALFGIAGALLLLCSSAIVVSRLAAPWLAPLPARAGAVSWAFLPPACLFIVGASAAEGLLLVVFNISYRVAAATALGTALTGCVLFGAALLWNLRRGRVQ